MKRTNLRVTDKMAEQVEELAAKRGIHVAEMYRELIAEGLHNSGGLVARIKLNMAIESLCLLKEIAKVTDPEILPNSREDAIKLIEKAHGIIKENSNVLS